MIADLAGLVTSRARIEDVLTNLVSASLALVPGADCAKVSVISDGHLSSIAATSQLMTSLDTAQQTARHGPCVQAIQTHRAVRCEDLRTDARWPGFALHAATAGVHSVLSSPIDVPGHAGATLSLFGFHTNVFGAESETIGAMLANHAAIAARNDEQERQFRSALDSRDTIGQAKGMIMERFGVDAARAFAMLRTISQDTNTPVRYLASRLVESGRQQFPVVLQSDSVIVAQASPRAGCPNMTLVRNWEVLAQCRFRVAPRVNGRHPRDENDEIPLAYVSRRVTWCDHLIVFGRAVLYVRRRLRGPRFTWHWSG